MLKKSVSLKQILEKINEFHVFKKYAPPFEVGKMFRGDVLRTKREKHPSCNIYYNGKRWKYNDFGCCSFNCWDYMQAKFNITFEEALIKVDEDFNLGIGYNSNILYSNTQYDYKNIIVPNEIKRDRKVIQIKRSKWGQKEVDYWKSNGWLGNMVKACNIHPIDAYFMNDHEGNLLRFDTSKILAFSYDYYLDDQGIFQRKIYMPFSKKKWVSNVNVNTIQGWGVFPKSGDIAFIQSSMKDLGPTWRTFGRPVGLAPNNEGSFLPEHIWFKIKPRYKKWVIFYDGDEAGIKNARKFSEMYDIPYIFLPIKGGKDASDWWKNNGGREFNYYLNRELDGIRS